MAVVVEVEAVKYRQASLGTVEFGHSNRSVEFDDRRTGLDGEGVVERHDLSPVAWPLQMQVGDGCLHGIGAGFAARDRLLEQRAAFVDLLGVPQGAVLIVEQNVLTVAEAGVSSGVVSSMRASSARTSPSSGMSSARARPSSMASVARSMRPPPQPWLNTR